MKIWSKASHALHSCGCSFTLILFVTVVLLVSLLNYKNIIRMSSANCHTAGPISWLSEGERIFTIRRTWDGKCVPHEPVKISLSPSSDGNVVIKVIAPFFNSPMMPLGKAGEPFPHLWDYEVVEAFFLNDRQQYLEVELCPHGQHLLLILNGQRKMVEDALPLKSFKATIVGDRWTGEATIPLSYFPPRVTLFNAYAIHGEGSNRTYESLYPATEEQDAPDFHRLEYFQPLNFAEVVNNYNPDLVSDLWKKYIKQ